MLPWGLLFDFYAIDDQGLPVVEAALLGMVVAGVSAGLGEGVLDEHEGVLFAKSLHVLAEGVVDPSLVFARPAVVVEVYLALDLQDFLALLDELLQVVEAFLGADLVENGTE